MKELVGARIVTPGDWTDLDLDPASRHGSVRRAVRQAVVRDPGLAGNAIRLIGLLDDIARRAWDSGAFYCSSLVLGTLPTGVLAANVLMQLTPDDGERAAVAGAAEICAGLAAAVSCDPDWIGADVEVVTLPMVGEAVRIEVVAGGICVQYLVPVQDSSRQVVLTFTSPFAPYAEVLLELFDSMASSFALEYSDSELVVVGGTAESTRPNE
ncbi:MAG: hypothetical protein ACRDV3_17255 [Acidothermaceae bacterium]